MFISCFFLQGFFISKENFQGILQGFFISKETLTYNFIPGVLIEKGYIPMQGHRSQRNIRGLPLSCPPYFLRQGLLLSLELSNWTTAASPVSISCPWDHSHAPLPISLTWVLGCRMQSSKLTQQAAYTLTTSPAHSKEECLLFWSPNYYKEHSYFLCTDSH